MTYFDMGFMDNSTSFIQIVDGVNNISGGLLMPTILLVLAMISFIGLKMGHTETDDAILVSSFITATLSVLFLVIGWVGVEIFILPVVILLIGIFIKIANR